jgi:hypothetical protein
VKQLKSWIEQSTCCIKEWLALKETVTYLIKLKDAPFDLYITNKPNNEEDTSYSRDRRRAREFAGLEDVSIDMTKHRAIKKKVTETTEYEEVEYD